MDKIKVYKVAYAKNEIAEMEDMHESINKQLVKQRIDAVIEFAMSEKENVIVYSVSDAEFSRCEAHLNKLF